MAKDLTVEALARVLASERPNGSGVAVDGRARRGEPKKILREIRDEMRAMREAQASTNERLEHLEKRQAEDTIRLATELVAVSKAIGQVRDLLRDRKVEREQLADHEKRLRQIERKIA